MRLSVSSDIGVSLRVVLLLPASNDNGADLAQGRNPVQSGWGGKQDAKWPSKGEVGLFTYCAGVRNSACSPNRSLGRTTGPLCSLKNVSLRADYLSFEFDFMNRAPGAGSIFDDYALSRTKHL